MYYQETVPILQYRTDYKDKKEEDLVQQDYYFQDDETTDEVVEEVKKEEKLFHAKKWENSKYLRKYIYQIDSTTMATENELNGKVLLNTNLKLRKSDEPQILIYHTHGSEAYCGSRKGRKSDTVIGVGDVLTKRLEQKNIKVVHDRNIYDVKNGKEERSKAYNYAATAIEKNLKKYPSIQVVIDLHRDGVNESTKLVTRQNGKRMAQIMFFNGMSRTATNGNIKYLKNPNKQTNLAFSLQLQAQAALKYPGFTRKIYVKGYRYNLHYRGRSLLVEVGAQNNTLSEAKASMSLLAELLNNVLY
jgi:stage II sporulation protein P